MDIRIDSNIGLDFMQSDCIQQSFIELMHSTENSALLLMKCEKPSELENKFHVRLTLFHDAGNTIITGMHDDFHFLLVGLVSDLKRIILEKDSILLSPIKINTEYSKAV